MTIHWRTVAIGAALASWLFFTGAEFQAQVAKSGELLRQDGTVNLGRIGSEKGVWELYYVENMANYMVRGPGSAERVVREFDDVTRRKAASEPHVPFMKWSAAVYDYNVRNLAKYDPEGYCLPPGGPRLFTAPYPMDIIQPTGQDRVIFLFEGGTHIWREIYMDGRPHPAANQIKSETWLGHSIGRYEDHGRTFVVDVMGFNEGSWLDFAGHPHTNLLHVVERFSRPSKDRLHYEATIDDPGAYTRPWTVAWDAVWWPGGELDEYICQENNKYLQTLKDDLGNPIFR